MVDNTQIFIMACITILYFILPAYVSNGSALVFGGGLPLDFKKTDKNGNRWIGNGVTWRGLIGGTIMGTLMGAIQGLLGPIILENFGEFIYTPICTNLVEGILVGFLLGFGAMVGDAIGSFLKRRVGSFSITFVAIAVVLTLIIHLVANTGAYLIGIKDVWY